MIRSITPHDIPALMALADAIGLFQPDELEILSDMLTDHFDTRSPRAIAAPTANEPERVWITDDDNGLVGVAHYAPEPLSNGIWNLYLIGVHPDCQGQGRGKALLHSVEDHLRAIGARMLLIETSGLASFERTRAFYRQHNYEEEARIRDYYNAGDDKIIYRKLLAA